MRKSQEDNILGLLFKVRCENSQKVEPFHTSLDLKRLMVYPDKLLSSKSLPVVLLLLLSRIPLTQLYFVGILLSLA